MGEAFADAFSRYLPVSIRHNGTNEEIQTLMPKNHPSQNTAVTDEKHDLTTEKISDVTRVTDQKPGEADTIQYTANMEPLCWNCGAAMAQTKDIDGRQWWACSECARTA